MNSSTKETLVQSVILGKVRCPFCNAWITRTTMKCECGAERGGLNPLIWLMISLACLIAPLIILAVTDSLFLVLVAFGFAIYSFYKMNRNLHLPWVKDGEIKHNTLMGKLFNN